MIPRLFHFRALPLLLLCAALIGSLQSNAEEVWWSLKPLVRPAIPGANSAAANPIDAFVQAQLEHHHLSPSPEADRRTLIRRLYFDLLGLPPSPEEVERFVNETNPLAYENLVDRLLESPRYGERWARYWLDTVHYGDTHGYDKDKPRPHAWPYRDYVIRSFNEDKPYWKFVQEQIAGDQLFPGTPDGIEALGFISAGPWDFIGHEEVPETKVDGKIARHLDRNDMVANTMNTFVSITVQCAQCHNHKFDPISSEDYYSLQADFAALDRTTVDYYRDVALNQKFTALNKREKEAQSEVKRLEAEIETAGGEGLAEARKALELNKKSDSERFGYHSGISSDQFNNKWVQIDLGERKEFSSIRVAPCHDDFAGIGDGFGFPLRFKIEASDDSGFQRDVQMLADVSGSDLANPGIKPLEYSFAQTKARFIRVTALKLAPRLNDFIFALAELQVFDSSGNNLAAKSKISALDSIEAPPRWQKENLVDGVFPASTKADLASANEASEAYERIWKAVPLQLRTDFQAATNSLAEIVAERKRMPAPDKVYVGAIHNGSGNFRGTGPDGGKARPIFLLNRGDVRKPGKEVEPGALSCVPSLPGRFTGLHSEGERRAALAHWITDKSNPLTWRSIVNRVWQYHFGRGLVETPNDFGRMGMEPTHPELLDWLAVEFRDGGQSIKALHKLIVTSATYRQVSTVSSDQSEASRRDSDNQWLWRMNRRKLDAEAIHDSILWVSGRLNEIMYGSAYQDFKIEHPEHSPHYLYDLDDPEAPEVSRRAIYRFIVRSQPEPFMAALDCADPSMLVPKRSESVSPTQALALLNNDFVVVQSRHFAERLVSQTRNIKEQIRFAIRESLGRPATGSEVAPLEKFAQANGLANTCRLIFNLNEFMFVD